MDKKNNDGFIVCPHCGSQVCYSQQVDGQDTYMCLTCGWTSTSLMKEGSELEQSIKNRYPTLYSDLRFVDTNGIVWYPAVLTMPERGMVYIDGSSTENWEWVFTPMRELTVKEQRLKKYEGQKYIADTDKTQHFGKDGFTEAAIAAGLFGEEETSQNAKDN